MERTAPCVTPAASNHLRPEQQSRRTPLSLMQGPLEATSTRYPQIMKPLQSTFLFFIFIVLTGFAADDVPRKVTGQTPSVSEWPDKATCDAVASKITGGMTRKEVEQLLKPFRPFPCGGGTAGGAPLVSWYLLAPTSMLAVWYDMHQPSRTPTHRDRVDSKLGVSIVPIPQSSFLTDEEFRRFQGSLK